MERTLEFKNFKIIGTTISADLYLENEFIVTMSNEIDHIFTNQNTQIKLYNYYRNAILTYLSYNNHDVSYNEHMTTFTNH